MSLTNASVQTQTAFLIGLVTVISITVTFFYKKWKKEKIPSKWERVGTVTKLHLYPLKSGGKIELETAEVTPIGIREANNNGKPFQLTDRVLVVYNAKDNEFRTGRTYPKLVFVQVSVQDQKHLAINAPNMKTLYVKIPNPKEQKPMKMNYWQGEMLEAFDCGDEAELWFSNYLLGKDSGLRLAYYDFNHKRDITKAQKKLVDYYKNLGNHSTGLFQDLTSVSLINQRSVNDLNTRMGDSPVVTETFRHNIIVDGPNLQPYAEDNWDWIKVGENVVLRNVKDCTRCLMATVNPEKGILDPDRQPVKTLEKYRKHNGPEKHQPRLGNNLDVRRTGIINVGDAVYIAK